MRLTRLCYNHRQMKLSNQAGFTIIETMLFLGITALLVMGVLVGTGTSINIQRYRDSVSSFQSVLQQQFSEVSNVSNDSLNNDCYGDGSTNNPRGQSNCVILGRLITTTNSRVLSIRNVIGSIPSDSVLVSNDVEALQQYNVQISPVAGETYEIEWGSSIVKPGGNVAMVFSMLILRSPSSGAVRTFINTDEAISDNAVVTLINQTALTTPAKICVDSNGLFNSVRTAVEVMASAANASGVEILGEATSGC